MTELSFQSAEGISKLPVIQCTTEWSRILKSRLHTVTYFILFLFNWALIFTQLP